MQFFLVICFLFLSYLFIKYNISSIETKIYNVENKKIPIEFDGYSIIQVSDLHSEVFGKNNRKLLKKIDDLKPDIVVITGDLIDGENNNYQVALDFMDELIKKYKVYYIIGNHEQKSLLKKYKSQYEKYFQTLYKKDFVFLDNKSVKIKRGESYINLYGLTVPYECYRYLFDDKQNIDLNKNDIDNLLGKADTNYNILLAHTPFYFDEYVKWGADLILSGHVHGGIIRIPFVGGLLSPNRKFFPKYDLGSYIKNKSEMIVSKGLGGSKVLIRVNCRPEIVNIILKCK